MKVSLQFHRRSAAITGGLLVTLMVALALLGRIPSAFSNPAEATGNAALLDGYRHVEVASVSDAMEKLTGQRIFLSHRMRPIFH